MIDQFLGVNATTDTMTGQKLPSPSTVSVSVLNGTGTYNQATTTSNALQALGFRIAGVGDTPSVGAQSETVVYYATKTPAGPGRGPGSGPLAVRGGHHRPRAHQQRGRGHRGHRVAVRGQRPRSGGGNGHHGAGAATPATTSTPTTTASSSGAFQPPTAAVSPLQPWDPRSCTPQGGEGP